MSLQIAKYLSIATCGWLLATNNESKVQKLRIVNATQNK